MGGWFRAISPAVVHGMLAGIGVLIVIGQYHVLFDAKPLSNAPENLAAMPGRLLGLSLTDIAAAERAFAIGLIIILGMIGWERFRAAKLKLVPGALVGAVVGTLTALAAILVATGWRLVNLTHVKHLFHGYGLMPVAIWAVTLITVVAPDLLTGVLVGIGLSALELILHFRRLGLKVHQDGQAMTLDGTATFLTLPRLTAAIEGMPAGTPLTLDVSRLRGADHTAAERLRDRVGRRRAGGSPVSVTGDSARPKPVFA